MEDPTKPAVNKEATEPSVTSSTALRQEKFGMPQAIVVAGLIIAAAIFMSGSGVSVGSADPLYVALAKEVGASERAFEACLLEREASEAVNADLEEGVAALSAVPQSGTPFFVVINGNGDRYPFSGALPIENFRDIVEDALATTASGAAFSNANSSAAAAIRDVDSSDYIRGNPDAPISIIEYSDFQCPFCQRVHPTLLQLLDEYPEDVRWVYRHLPLTSIHSEALPAAIASECVGLLEGNESFWEYTDKLFQNQASLGS